MPAVQPDNRWGSLIPRSAVTVGRVAIQSASRGDMIVRIVRLSGLTKQMNKGDIHGRNNNHYRPLKFGREKGSQLYT